MVEILHNEELLRRLDAVIEHGGNRSAAAESPSPRRASSSVAEPATGSEPGLFPSSAIIIVVLA